MDINKQLSFTFGGVVLMLDMHEHCELLHINREIENKTNGKYNFTTVLLAFHCATAKLLFQQQSYFHLDTRTCVLLMDGKRKNTFYPYAPYTKDIYIPFSSDIISVCRDDELPMETMAIKTSEHYRIIPISNGLGIGVLIE